MKATFETIHPDFDVPDDTKLGDMFEIIGTARVVAVEEELVVTVYPGLAHVPSYKATLVSDVGLLA